MGHNLYRHRFGLGCFRLLYVTLHFDRGRPKLDGRNNCARNVGHFLEVVLGLNDT